MNKALNQTLASLPDDTRVYVGHEYTKANVAFSASVDPDNEAIKKLKSFVDSNEVTTGAFTIGDEKEHNVRRSAVLRSIEPNLVRVAQVFMRLSSPAVLKATGAKSDVEAMGALREMKVRPAAPHFPADRSDVAQNNFKG
jgi:hydroxyacylglutathione hydrolase